MRVFALEPDNIIKGLQTRLLYLERLIAALPEPDFVVLPELAVCSCIPGQDIWRYADDAGAQTGRWAMAMAEKYNTVIGTGYLDRESGDYYNRYLIADSRRVCGTAAKSHGDAAICRRGSYDCVIPTPFGNVAVGIGQDAWQQSFYDKIAGELLSLILFPQAHSSTPKKLPRARREIAYLCAVYEQAFQVPVVFANSTGRLERLPGRAGLLPGQASLALDGQSQICCRTGRPLDTGAAPGAGMLAEPAPRRRCWSIPFHQGTLVRESPLMRRLILRPDIRAGQRTYQAAKER